MEGFMIRTGFYDKCVRLLALPSHEILSRQQLHSEDASTVNEQRELGLMIVSPFKSRAG